jgi:hypothetical protein
MQKTESMQQILGVCLSFSAFIAGTPAMADVACNGENGSAPVVKAFELWDHPSDNWSKNAAIIVQTETSKKLLTGQSVTKYGRTPGRNVRIEVKDTAGAESYLNYTVFDEDTNNPEVFGAIWKHEGKSYALTCKKEAP